MSADIRSANAFSLKTSTRDTWSLTRQKSSSNKVWNRIGTISYCFFKVSEWKLSYIQDEMELLEKNWNLMIIVLLKEIETKMCKSAKLWPGWLKYLKIWSRDHLVNKDSLTWRYYNNGILESSIWGSDKRNLLWVIIVIVIIITCFE